MVQNVLGLLTAFGFPGMIITGLTLYFRNRKDRRREPIDNASLVQDMTIKFSQTINEKLLEAETKLQAAEARAELLDAKLENAMRKIWIYEMEFSRRGLPTPTVPTSNWETPPITT